MCFAGFAGPTGPRPSAATAVADSDGKTHCHRANTMNTYQLWTSFYTMLRKDMVRIFRIWVQTFLPSIITSCLYFLIFGSVLGSRIGTMQGVSYMSFVVPGLVMQAIVTNAYSNTSFTFFQSKFFMRSIDEILVSPTPPWLLIAGFVSGGVVRGMLVGALVMLISVFFTGLHMSIANAGIIFLFALLTAIVFALAGLVNGVYAKTLDAINIVPTFVLTPLTYLGGVFYSVHSLPQLAQYVTYVDPIFYLINGFRYGFLGIADIPLWISLAVLAGLITTLIAINWYLIRKGLGLKQ
jgi:ABC-2 type transport system permease protein